MIFSALTCSKTISRIMGGGDSKEEAAPKAVFKVSHMYYDADGNVRVGKKVERKRDDELRRVLSADTPDDDNIKKEEKEEEEIIEGEIEGEVEKKEEEVEEVKVFCSFFTF